MNKKWVVLCSAAIGAVYAAGFVTTGTQADMTQAQSYAQASMPAAGSLQAGSQDNGQAGTDQLTGQTASSPAASASAAPANSPAGGTAASPTPNSQANAQTTGNQTQSTPAVSKQTLGRQTITYRAPASPSPAGPANTPKPTASQTGNAANSASQTANSQVQQVKRVYKDGTFEGMGMNRRGSIQVAVTLKNDKITDVEISDFGMHYSERDIINLPAQVVKLQSPRVRNVSGATYSTMAFAQAVQDALNQARNA